MTRKSTALACTLLMLCAASAWLAYDYFHSLTIIEAKILAIVPDPANPDARNLRVAIAADFPEYRFIPDRMRRFFFLQPTLCLVTPDGQPMLNDDVQSHCFSEREPGGSRDKRHTMERSEFDVPFLLVPTPYNGERRFFKGLLRERGMTVLLRLQGFIFPPAVDSAPLFLSLQPWCQTAPQECAAMLAK
jgi:hypothetical protein